VTTTLLRQNGAGRWLARGLLNQCPDLLVDRVPRYGALTQIPPWHHWRYMADTRLVRILIKVVE
jgi:hypothetical protein